MNYKLCILAAGSGRRMRPLTDKINKALLPVNYKAAISHVIEKHNANIEIIIAVNYEKDKIKQYLKCAHPDRKITFVEVPKIDGQGSGPGFSLICCRKYLNMPFVFSTIDTLYKEDCPQPTKNWMGISEVEDPKNFCTVKISPKQNLIKSFIDKSKFGTNLAFIGIAGIKNHEEFFSSLIEDKTEINQELQVSNGFNGLLNKELKSIKFSWYDIGNKEGYYKANKYFSKNNIEFDFSKKDEYIYFINNNVIKYFSESEIVKNRIKRTYFLPKITPNIIDQTTNFYSYEKIDGKVIYDQKNINVINELLRWLKSELWTPRKLSDTDEIKFFKACKDFYYKKTIKRLKKYYERFECKDQQSIVNNIKIGKVSELLEKIDFNFISKGLPTKFHGDLQFDNILLTKKNTFKLLDWRQDFSGLIEYGDMYYDLAKLNGGLYISYKKIKKNKFDIEFSNDKINLSLEKDYFLIKSKEIFDNFVLENNYDLVKIEILTGLIFLNMSPMHHSPFSHYVYYLGKKQLSKWINISKN